MRLLVAEDNPKLVRALRHILTTSGYLVDTATTGDDALLLAESGEYDGLVLDIMLPELDGVSLLRQLRAQGITTPALFLTARTEVCERVEGLDAGADDYLAKPFQTTELLARIRAMLRRRESFQPELLQLGALALNCATYQLSYEESRAQLSGKEFQIMEMLMQRPGTIVTTDSLMTHIWGWDSDVDVSALWVHISNIRKKLAQLEAPVSIRFIRGGGYVLEQDR
ncbi:MAG: response regulator transcription factor [Peptococcaceae bacterium]|nr:response regulator transcription factor [Peptococcaceae bacterium]